MRDRGDRPLLGRRREQEVLAGLLREAREGHSGVCVVRGEPGIGKTALLEDMVRESHGLCVIACVGVKSEMELPFAGLQQLSSPLLHLAERLPAPQRHALNVVLGVEEADGAPDALLVGLALLTLLAEAGSVQPTVCIIDDAQWIDEISLLAFAFAARRLFAEPVVMVFATREQPTALAGLPELVLSGLTDQEARTLLMRLLPGRLTDRARETIVADSAGNPLALHELHRALKPALVAGGYGLAMVKPVSGRIEELFGRQVADLPAATRRLLLIAAAEPTGNPSWMWAAAAALGVGVQAAEPAESAGLVDIGGRVRFRHPLVRSAVYDHAAPAERRLVHGALADAIDRASSADHRAWHRAYAAAVPDEQVAEELQDAAEQGRRRGGAAAAAAFLAKAVDLTPDTRQRGVRALRAAEAKIDAGAFESAATLVESAGDWSRDEEIGIHADLIRARLAFAARRGRDGPPLLLAAARRLTAVDAAKARQTYLEAFMAALIVGRFTVGTASWPGNVAREARQAPTAEGRPGAVDLLLDGLIVRFTEGHAAGAPLLKAGLAAYARDLEAGTADPRWHDLTSRVSLDLFDQDAYNSLTIRQLEKIREAGNLTALPAALWTHAGLCVGIGRIADAMGLLDEATAITTATGAPSQISIEPYLAAYRGQSDHCLSSARATIEGATARGEGTEVTVSHYAVAILHNAQGEYARALASAQEGLRDDDFGLVGYLLPEVIEAAARCGQAAVAADALSRLTERANASATPTACGVLARSRALLAEDTAAEAHYLEAIDQFGRSPVVVFTARTHLVYGEWLRRVNRRSDARVHLRTAYDMCTAMGVDGFASRARRELQATGENVPVGPARGVVALTPQERQIVRLARDGHTNSEIGARLFISARTVEWHLGRIFPKLGVTSRRQLRSVLSALT